jgi:putative hydrolase of the HAD superfamily
MEDYLSHQGISKELFKVEIDNLKLYGYGIKGYILSMIGDDYLEQYHSD